MVAYRLMMYTPMGWIPTASIASNTKGYYHFTPDLRCSSWWWNPTGTLIIYPVTTSTFTLWLPIAS